MISEIELLEYKLEVLKLKEEIEGKRRTGIAYNDPNLVTIREDIKDLKVFVYTHLLGIK